MTDETSTTEEHCFRLMGEVDGTQFTFDLVDEDHVAGASEGCDLEIAMPGVSRRHAKLSVTDGTLLVNDLDAATADLERRMIAAALARTKGNRSKAAKLLGISRNGLALKMDRPGLN